MDVFRQTPSSSRVSTVPTGASGSAGKVTHGQGPQSALFGNIDYVPCNLPLSTGIGKCIVFEDNDAVIKQCVKGRSPALRHVARTHRVDLDWLWERIREDPGAHIKYVGTRAGCRHLYKGILLC